LILDNRVDRLIDERLKVKGKRRKVYGAEGLKAYGKKDTVFSEIKLPNACRNIVLVLGATAVPT